MSWYVPCLWFDAFITFNLLKLSFKPKSNTVCIRYQMFYLFVFTWYLIFKAASAAYMGFSHICPGKQHLSAASSGLRLQQVGLACCQVNLRQLHFNVLAPATAAVWLLAQVPVRGIMWSNISGYWETVTQRLTENPSVVNHGGHRDGWNAFSPTANNNKCTEIDAASVL